jgi:NAD(P)-dependent dehydrogenase (short-subunit alcohol dehydrogenase family)
MIWRMTLGKPTTAVRRVAISGAAGGIGRCLTREAVTRGYTELWLIDQDQIGLNALSSEMEPSCDVRQFVINLDDRKDLARVTDAWECECPELLLNVAGIRASSDPITATTDEDWDRAIATNLTAPFLLTRSLSASMQRHGISGVIVNIASTASVMGFPNRAAYCASKAGLVGLTRAAALDLAPYNIRVFAISPGFTSSGISDDLDDTVVKSSVPLGTRGSPSDLAQLVFDVAVSPFVTGANFLVDGGASVGAAL